MSRFRKIQTLAISAALALATIIGVTASPAFAGVQPAGVMACNSSTVNWAATYPTAQDWLGGQNATHCIGGIGTFSVPSNNTAIFCAGDNNGIVWYHDLSTGTSASHTFWADTSYYVSNGTYKEAPGTGIFSVIDDINVYQVQINGSTGSAGC